MEIERIKQSGHGKSIAIIEPKKTMAELYQPAFENLFGAEVITIPDFDHLRGILGERPPQNPLSLILIEHLYTCNERGLKHARKIQSGELDDTYEGASNIPIAIISATPYEIKECGLHVIDLMNLGNLLTEPENNSSSSESDLIVGLLEGTNPKQFLSTLPEPVIC